MEELVMQKLCTSDTPSLLLALILHDLLSFCSFLSSKPLHLVYFILFSPHIVQCLSFFSPLLLSTFLLLVVLLTVFPCLGLSPSLSFEYLGSTCSVVLYFLSVDLEEHETIGFMEQHVLLFFQSSSNSCRQEINLGFDQLEQGPIMLNLDDDDVFLDSLVEIEDAGENYHVPASKNSVTDVENSVSTLLSKSENGEAFAAIAEGTPIFGDNLLSDKNITESKCRSEIPELQDDRGGEALSISASVRPKKYELEVPDVLIWDESMKKDEELAFAENLQRDGSMRKEKEWKRTLACKLYEERMKFKLCDDRKVAEGGEQMDLLWEAYEMNGSKFDKSKSRGKKAKKAETEQVEEEEGDDDDDDDGSTTGKVCCLQALRLSTGKMNLGVGRPNLVKISKVLKGMTLFGIGSQSSRKR